MEVAASTFPEGFLWGADISATQVEGAWDEGGKTPVETDYMVGVDKTRAFRYGYFRQADGSEGTMGLYSGELPRGAQMILKEGVCYPNHVASDFYHHYAEDLELMAKMGLKALNLTISWARVLPHGSDGGVNQAGVEFYKAVLAKCVSLGMEPVITLYKYDMPFFLVSDFGGWSNRKLIYEFVEFARVCFSEFGGFCKRWVTFNEINILKVMADKHPNAGQDFRDRVVQELHNQFVASALVVRLAHKVSEDNKVGCMVLGALSYPLTANPLDVRECQSYMRKTVYLFSDVLVRGKYPRYADSIFEEFGARPTILADDVKILGSGTVDFLAFSYYSSSCLTVGDSENADGSQDMLMGGARNPYLSQTAWGWQIDPNGLGILLRDFADRYPDTPLLILENGIGQSDVLDSAGKVHDQYRIDYLREHIRCIAEAVGEGINLLGYFVWSCMDLVSASTGEMRKRYGLIYVDAADDGSPTGSYARVRKDSSYWYEKVCRSNGLTLD